MYIDDTANKRRNAFLTGTYLNSDDVLRKALEIQKRKIEDAKTVAKGKDYVLLVIIQPWPKLFWQLNQGNGIGNVLGLERFDENMIRMQPFQCATTYRRGRMLT